jgi:hypothetical protein
MDGWQHNNDNHSSPSSVPVSVANGNGNGSKKKPKRKAKGKTSTNGKANSKNNSGGGANHTKSTTMTVIGHPPPTTTTTTPSTSISSLLTSGSGVNGMNMNHMTASPFMFPNSIFGSHLFGHHAHSHHTHTHTHTHATGGAMSHMNHQSVTGSGHHGGTGLLGQAPPIVIAPSPYSALFAGDALSIMTRGSAASALAAMTSSHQSSSVSSTTSGSYSHHGGVPPGFAVPTPRTFIPALTATGATIPPSILIPQPIRAPTPTRPPALTLPSGPPGGPQGGSGFTSIHVGPGAQSPLMSPYHGPLPPPLQLIPSVSSPGPGSGTGLHISPPVSPWSPQSMVMGSPAANNRFRQLVRQGGNGPNGIAMSPLSRSYSGSGGAPRTPEQKQRSLASMRTGLVYDARCLLHRGDPRAWESPERVEVILFSIHTNIYHHICLMAHFFLL